MAMQNSNIITPREQMEMDYQREMTEKHMNHERVLKQMGLKSQELSQRWVVVFKLPLALLTLPVKLMVCLGLIVYAIRGIEPPESLTSFIRVW